MEKYDYMAQLKEDVAEWIKENDFDTTQEDAEEILNDRLFCEDSVTGNASGSYTFNAWQAEENLCHNWDLLEEACDEFGNIESAIKGGAEACDVFIRCYLLPNAIAELLQEMED
jgi:hypothetical protein